MKNVDEIIEKIWNSENGEIGQQTSNHAIETLHAVLNSLAEGVVVADNEGKFIIFNSVAERILGIGSKDVTPEEWPSLYGLFHPKRKTPYSPEDLPLARAIKGEETTDELILTKNQERPDGIFISVSAKPLRDRKGLIKGGTAVFRDVTESIRSEERLMESEERVKALFKGFPMPSYVWQRQEDDFILIDYNNAAEAISPDKLKTILGSKLSVIYANQPYLKNVQADFSRCFEEKISFGHEVNYRYQGSREVKELIVNYVFIPPDLILVYTENITERKRNELELRKLSNAVEQTADSVVIANQKGIIEYVNPAFEAISGYRREEIIGQTPRILQSGEHDAAFYKNLWTTIQSGKPFEGTIINKKKNGELFWTQQTITPMKDNDGNINNFVSVWKDITELRAKQEQEFELSLARKLQQRLYETTISVPGFDIAGSTFSAVETNGDYFDFFNFPDGSIGLVVGDVCGHGLGPALIMAQLRAYLRAFVRKESDPAVLLTLLNQVLTDDLDESHYVTLILARLDPQKNVMDYASAGHVPCFLINADGKKDLILESTGIPLGFLHDSEYSKSEPIKLSPDHILVLLTDGISETQSQDEIEFGYDRVLETIHSDKELSSEQITANLYQAVRSFTKNGNLEDDITSIICKVNNG